MRAFLAICFSLGLLSVPASTPAAAADRSEWGFTCTDRSKLADITAGTDTVQINNFSLREIDAFNSKDFRYAEVAFSVANRRDSEVHLEAQFLLMGNGNLPTIVVTASPLLDLVEAGNTTLAKGKTLVALGETPKVTTVCMRFVGDF